MPGNGKDVGLAELVSHFNIKPDKVHNAGNGVAYKMIASILLALKQDLYGDLHVPLVPVKVKGVDIRDVITRVKKAGLARAPLTWGRPIPCKYCKSEEHTHDKCTQPKFCDKCWYFGDLDRRNKAHTHWDVQCGYEVKNAKASSY
jgi:hypothetical protein